MTSQTLTLAPIDFVTGPLEVPFLLCRIPPGFPSPAQDDIEEPIDLAAWLMMHPAASYVMRVAGHSMTGAGINDGDLIIVNRAKRPLPGCIVVAIVHGERTLKRLRRRDGRLWLVAENTGFPPVIVDEHVEVWGVVEALARRYP